jgi:serine/threonine protein kinase
VFNRGAVGVYFASALAWMARLSAGKPVPLSLDVSRRYVWDGKNMELVGSATSLGSGVQVGEYRLQGVVGEGGFGIVYRAIDLSLDRVVAIKEYMPATLAGRTSSNQVHVRPQHKGTFDAGLRSFINEARLLAKFSHPALVHVYRFFEANGTAYMAMRYYEGQTLKAFLAEQKGKIDERWLSAILSPLLDVLEMLHTADCFHRDIAPDNIFLQSTGVPVLLDFGAARRVIGDMTQALTMVLKPGYAPIEQYADDGGMPQGAWTDIYQLGALLHFAITGRVPATSVARMISDPLKVLTPQEYPGFSAQFLHGVHRALAVKPSERPQSIAELKALLGVQTFSNPASQGWAGSEPVPLDVLTVDRRLIAAEQSTASSKHSAQDLMSSLMINGVPLTPPTPQASTGQGHANVRSSSGPAAIPGAKVAQSVERGQSSAQSAVAHPSDGVQKTSDAIKSAPSPAPNQPLKVMVDRRAATPAATVAAGANGAGAAVANNGRKSSWANIQLGILLLCFVLLSALVWHFYSAQDTSKEPHAQAWLVVKQAPSIETLEAFVSAYPDSEYAAEASTLLNVLREAAAQQKQAEAAISGASTGNEVAEIKPSDTTPLNVTSSGVNAGNNTQSSVSADVARQVAGTTNNQSSVAQQTAETSKPETTKPEIKKPLPADLGKVVFRVSPWGNIRINRSPAGASPPMTQLDLPEGVHMIEISNPASKTIVKEVHVKKGESVVVSHKFE